MSFSKTLIFLLFLLAITACSKSENNTKPEGSNIEFVKTGETILEGGKFAAEIAVYEPSSKSLFVNNNAVGNRIDIIDLSDVSSPKLKSTINLVPWPSEKVTINSLAIHNGLLAVSADSLNPQGNGNLFIFDSRSFERLKEISVGPMPDMVTFTPDGNYILTANEGEPNQEYTSDPEGSISLISTKDFSVETISFTDFADSTGSLQKGGFRVFGPNADLPHDVEPEYITVSDDSKFAWVTLQENNGIAKIDIQLKKVINIFPLGFKDFDEPGNEIDICDEDSLNFLANWPIKGMFQPDAISWFKDNGKSYLITANEGDSRVYEGFSEQARIQDLQLDSSAFPNRYWMKLCEKLGRLNVTITQGDTDGDGDFDQLYCFGSRSFSIWDGETGEMVVDSKNDLEFKIIENTELYDDNRSDDKGTEPEGVTIGKVGETHIAFIGLERANAVVTYNLNDPFNPRFMQALEVGIGPEGLLFIPDDISPNGKNLLVVSSEIDGKIILFQPRD